MLKIKTLINIYIILKFLMPLKEKKIFLFQIGGSPFEQRRGRVRHSLPVPVISLISLNKNV